VNPIPDILVPILTGLHVMLIGNVLLNWLFFVGRRALQTPGPLPSVSVLVPARNEEHNLPRLLASMATQDHPDAEFLIYDDLSEDRTWEIIEAAEDPRVTGIRGGALPEGWVGKTNGCHQLAQRARGEVILFIDADTEFLHPGALRRMCERFAARPPDTVYTGMTLLTGKGRIIVTMVGTLILTSIPWWLGRRVPFSVMSGLNGQCWMITRDDYRTFEPHRQVRGEVLEDVKIGRYLHGKGLKPILDDVTGDLAVYMYGSFSEAWRGFRKNTADILGPNIPGSLLTLSLFILLFLLAPLVSCWLLASLFVLKLISDRITRQPLSVSLLAPASYFLTVFLALDSIWTRARGRIEWKGRIIP
jgi:glycosyltransferase involved in cell wall biosynthesis